MTTDYYPRLCAASHDKEQSTKTVNEQAEIALLILGPVLVSFIIFGKLIVTLLYSNKFLPISEMLLWGALGMYFRAGSWSMGYLLLAKGNSKHFFYNELISNSYILILNILGYTYLGLKGLGISFLIGYFLHFLQIKYVSKKFYEVVYNNDFTKLFLKMICFGITAVLSSYFLSELTNYIVGSLIFIACSAISIYYLDKRLGFLQKFKIK
jgi:O-antigen/teichoic acid export membrane protein